MVKVEEPEPARAEIMLRGVVPVLERHHGLRVLPEAIAAAVALSHRYIADRQLPDKAVSVLSTAAAQVALSQQATPFAIEECQRRLFEIDSELSLLRREVHRTPSEQEREELLITERAQVESEQALLTKRHSEELALVSQVGQLRKELAGPISSQDAAARLLTLQQTLRDSQGETPLVYDCVSAQSVAEVVSSFTGIPIGKMVRDELQTVLSLGELLGRRVYGQDHALTALAERIAVSRAELEAPNRPDRSVSPRRSERSRQDRDGLGAGGRSVWWRAQHHHHQHVRVQRESQWCSAERGSSGLRRIWQRRRPDRGGAAQTVLCGAAG
jgi:type VI secretion system protein VasG